MKTQRFWLTLTLTLLLLDCAGLALLHALSRPRQRTDSQTVQIDRLINLQGKRLDSDHPACRVIHYTAKTCSFCEQENSVWLQLKFSALAKSVMSSRLFQTSQNCRLRLRRIRRCSFLQSSRALSVRPGHRLRRLQIRGVMWSGSKKV